MAEIPGLGKLRPHEDIPEWYQSEPVAIAAFGGQKRPVIVEAYDDAPKPEDFHAAIENFLTIEPAVLEQAESRIYDYYKTMLQYHDPDNPVCEPITEPEGVWKHIRFGTPMVTLNYPTENTVYVAIECGCDWEPEHGLQIVLRDGKVVTRISGIDGHLTD